MVFLSALWKRVFQPSNTLSLVPLVLIIPIILFEALSIAGCASTSPGIPEIYVVSLVPNTTTAADISIRIGFFGICASDGTGSTRCQSSARYTPPDTLVANLFPLSLTNTTTNATLSQPDALALSQTALALQSRILASPLAGCVLLFAAGVAFLLVFRREKARHARQSDATDERRRFRWSRRATYVCLWVHAALLFAAALAATTTMNALEFVSSAPGMVEVVGGGVEIERGVTMMVLQWMAFAFSLVLTLAVPVVVRPTWMLVAMYALDSKVGA
ncbi:Ca2+ regulator and membrane fusion protein Fig1-domain-containing protein [Schizothecium vesticola]|uniref:Ca2+ regulator and membrane fusion protein Fig1-domain-containing protein n=1 Tax=Schizothecium vesticola TaxID=314040 RepID=A0AA40FB86_9PEZI|nr:Ca2+ regulator and membrane fusion protein Fig1-domain-containing protein [Schizothecium vesticola]